MGGPAVRINTSGAWNNATLYLAEYQRATTTPVLRQYPNQSPRTTGTQLGSITLSLAIGDWLEIDAQGSTITVLVNGVAKISVTDASITSGTAGVAVRDGGQRGGLYWSPWTGGNLTSSIYSDNFTR